MVARDTAAIDAVSDEKISLGAWWTLTVLCLLYILSCADRLILSLLVEPIKQDLGLSDFQMGLILGPAFAVVYALFGVPLGWAADRFSRRWVIFGGAVFWSCATAAAAFATSFSSLLATRVAVGAGEAALTPSAYTLMADRFPKKRLTLAISIYQTCFPIGNFVALALGGLLIGAAGALSHAHFPIVSHLQPWQIALIMTGMPGVAVGILALTFREPRAGTKRASDSGNVWSYLRSQPRLYGGMAIGFSLASLCAYSLSSWAPTYIAREFNWTAAQFGPALGMVSLLAGSSMVVKGWFVDFLYSRGVTDAHLRFYCWLLAIALPVAFLTFFLKTAMAFLICYGLLQVICLQFGVYMAATVQLVAPPQLRGQVVAVLLAILSLVGLGVGPPLAGFLTDVVFGDPKMLGASLAIIVCASLPLALIALGQSLSSVKAAVGK